MLPRTARRGLPLLLLLAAAPAALRGQDRLAWIQGRRGDLLGTSITALGDLDGDGVPDWAVGAVQAFVSGRPSPGYVQIVSGRTGEALRTLEGASDHDDFGVALAGVGDVDRDGHADLLVGARFDDAAGPGHGAARLYSGRTGELLATFAGDGSLDEFGFAVSGVGDVDRDGFPDLLVGSPRDDTHAADAGSVFVFSGKDRSTLHAFTGAAAGEMFGFAVAGIGDVDQDGHGDFAVGAPQAGPSQEGEVQVFSGKTGRMLYVIQGAAAGDGLGMAVSGAGDLDGDGVPDLLVGAPRADLAYAYSGASGEPILTLEGPAPASRFGAALAGVGDLDGDGVGDLAVGAPRDDRGGSNSGSVTIYSGNSGTELAVLLGGAGERLGSSVAGLGDLDGDGSPEVAAGAPYADLGGQSSGVARVWSFSLGAAGRNAAVAVPPAEYQGQGITDMRVYESYTVYAGWPYQYWLWPSTWYWCPGVYPWCHNWCWSCRACGCYGTHVWHGGNSSGGDDSGNTGGGTGTGGDDGGGGDEPPPDPGPRALDPVDLGSGPVADGGGGTGEGGGGFVVEDTGRVPGDGGVPGDLGGTGSVSEGFVVESAGGLPGAGAGGGLVGAPADPWSGAVVLELGVPAAGGGSVVPVADSLSGPDPGPESLVVVREAPRLRPAERGGASPTRVRRAPSPPSRSASRSPGRGSATARPVASASRRAASVAQPDREPVVSSRVRAGARIERSDPGPSRGGSSGRATSGRRASSSPEVRAPASSSRNAATMERRSAGGSRSASRRAGSSSRRSSSVSAAPHASSAAASSSRSANTVRSPASGSSRSSGLRSAGSSRSRSSSVSSSRSSSRSSAASARSASPSRSSARSGPSRSSGLRSSPSRASSGRSSSSRRGGRRRG